MGSVAIGIDIGGTGIKAALVDLERGRLASERRRVLTPRPATPAACAKAIANLVLAPTPLEGPLVGAGFPGVVKRGRTLTAANVDPGWVDIDAGALIASATGRPASVLNDADAAGMAEVRFGAGKGHGGEIVMVTLGTGIGTGLFLDGRLVPNTELGHLEIRGKDAERRASAVARERRKLGWQRWARDVEEYLQRLEALLWPDLFIIGGGVSAVPERFLPYIKTRCPVVPAALGNDAGIIGAALHAASTAG